MSVTEVRAEVVVVGAGPTGLLAALLLAEYGHTVALIERWRSPYPLPRAVGISHDTLRALQSAEVIQQVLPQLIFTPDGSMGDETRAHDGEFLDVIPYRSTTVSGWPERAIFSQPDLEKTLDERLEAHPGVQLLRGWTVISVVGDQTNVVIEATTSEHPAGSAPDTLRATCEYVVGCDGANSVVRQHVGGRVEDLGFAYDWLVVDGIPLVTQTYDPTLGQILARLARRRSRPAGLVAATGSSCDSRARASRTSRRARQRGGCWPRTGSPRRR